MSEAVSSVGVARCMLVGTLIWLALPVSTALSDAIGQDAQGPVIVRSLAALRKQDSSSKKSREFEKAIRESDFRRIYKLFGKCAAAGDDYCQYFLGAGVSEWLQRTDLPKDPRYNDEFVRKWLYRAYLSDRTLSRVATELRTFYLFGIMGFPKNREISQCWSDVAVANRGAGGKENVRLESDRCSALVKKLIGYDPLTK